MKWQHHRSKKRTLAKVFFIVVFLLVLVVLPSGTAKADERTIDDWFNEARGQLLEFQNSELVSHASLILGSFVGLVALVSTWKGFHKNSKLMTFVFWVLLGLTLNVTIYCVGRLFYWSSLSSIAISATPVKVDLFIGENMTLANNTQLISILQSYCMSMSKNDSGITATVTRLLDPFRALLLAISPTTHFPAIGFISVLRIWRKERIMPACSRCRKGLRRDFRFCPFCGLRVGRSHPS